MDSADSEDDKRNIAKNHQRKRREKMSDEEREMKRSRDREYRKKKRMCDGYLEDGEEETESSSGFKSERLRLSEMKKKMDLEMKKYGITDNDLLFEKKLDDFEMAQCVRCDTFFWNNHTYCYCKSHPSILTSELMRIGNIPPELTGLSYLEELLISKVHPMISIYKLKGGQYGFKGNVINFRQDVSTFTKQLPYSITILKGIISVCCNTPGFHKDFLIKRNVISIALHWLKNNNKYYSDIEIDLDAIKQLPEEGHYTDFVHCDDGDNDISEVNECGDDNIERVIVPGIGEVSTFEKITHQLKWPQIHADPVNEFNSNGYIVQAFPVLFPYGLGDYLNLKSKQITARVYFQYLMQKIDRRFSKHKLFPYFALNSILRWEALSLGTLYMKKKPELKRLNIEHVKDIVKGSMTLPKSVMVYSSSIRGSKAYWMSRTYELEAMVDRFSLPTLFFSLSAADHHWPRQFEILLGDCESITSLTETERRNLLIDNADICSDYFYETVSIFITEVLVSFLKVLEYCFRFEWQMRGLMFMVYCGYMEHPKLLVLKKCLKQKKKNVIDYFNLLVSAWNPNCNYVVTASHPCRIRVSQVEDKLEDLAALVNTVQTHKCSLRCLRKTSKIVAQFKEMNGHLEFFPRRNDPNINKFMDFILRTYRANHDPTPILSYDGFVRYISNYATKGEVKSEDLLNVLKMIVFNSDVNQSVKSVVQKLFINLAADRDYSFQEVIHLLKGHKLYKSSRTFVVRNLSDDEWQAQADISVLSDTVTHHEKTIDTLSLYANRPKKYDKMTFYNSMKWFDMKTFKKYKKEHIVRIIPRFNKCKEISEAVWRQNALLNIPWRRLDELLVDDNWENTCSLYAITMDMFPYSINVKETVIENDDTNVETDSEDINKEDWINICDESFVEIFHNFLPNARKDSVITKGETHLPKLSPDQNNVLLLLQRQIKSLKGQSSENYPLPRISLCEGFAGTGKSILLQTMVKLVDSDLGAGSSWVLAPTGSSALHVNGQTIHSAIRLNWADFGNVPDLKGESLFKWREKHEKVKFIFIEEYSMVGCKLMYILHRRLCQLTEVDQSFGGLFLWFIGNIRQLPPVGDTPWHREDTRGAKAEVVAGSLLHKEIQTVYFLTSQLRQTNLHLLQCLENISTGKITENDKSILLSRFKTTSELDKLPQFYNAIHIFSRQKDVEIYNLHKLKMEEKPVLHIKAYNSSLYAKASSTDQAMGLQNVLFFSLGCRLMLKKNLWVDGGLVNGSLGTLVDIVYKSSEDDSPFVLIIKFDSYYGPVLNNGGVPILRCTNTWYTNNILCSRNMFPVQLAYAVTIYKSQGLTLPKVVFHVTGKEIAAGEFYVALSRVKTLQDLAIIYDGVIDECPLFNLNCLIYRERIDVEGKLRLKGKYSFFCDKMKFFYCVALLLVPFFSKPQEQCNCWCISKLQVQQIFSSSKLF
ncbi:ATP-dependent DNA helicase [Frankliniella fusca]|uniref:ATP-dependent DNA helicase n=1 Tax=Frankliniella fusca TaxID=407009 RepID=A0AAE1L9R1_9NEOP|nr:ATP-dependent DNA helicase [Frankliniella fusca]